MQNPIESQPSTTRPILVGIAVMIIGTILLYFLKFFGLTLKAILQKSISQASNSAINSNQSSATSLRPLSNFPQKQRSNT